MERINKRPKVLQANWLYLIMAILLITVGGYSQSKNIFGGLLITEYLLVLLPVILFLKIKGYSLKDFLRINKLSFKEYMLIPAITLLAYPVGAFLNAVMMIIISTIGEVKAPPLPIPSTGGSYLLGLFIIAITPGICEEVMFRGFLMKVYEGKGYKKAIFISAILFGIFHFNIQNLLGPIFLGVLFGFIVYRTNSLMAGIIGHATNNAFAWTLSYLLTKLNIPMDQMEQTAEVSVNISQTMSLIIGALTLLGIGFFTSILALYLYRKLPDRKVAIVESYDEEELSVEESSGTIQYIPIIITVVGFIILNIIAF